MGVCIESVATLNKNLCKVKHTIQLCVCARFKDFASSVNNKTFLPLYQHLLSPEGYDSSFEEGSTSSARPSPPTPLSPPRSPPPSSHHPVSYFDAFFAQKLVRLATSNNFCCFLPTPEVHLALPLTEEKLSN